MKKKTAALLFLCLLFSAACAENTGWMKVVNCEEWVSLREQPDAASECLVEVPLGAIVENCSVKTKAFTYAEYGGLSGYIMSQYLDVVPVEQTYLGDMTIADCGNWIAMHLGPAEEETVIRWMAPGTRIEDCVESIVGFVYGLCDGLKGYIRLTNLQVTNQELIL